MRGFVASLVVGRPDWIEEIMQSTYLVAWQKLGGFEYQESAPDEELIRWMCTIARFESLNYLRKQRTVEATIALDMADFVAEYQVEHADALEDRFQALKGCLQRLTARQREVLHLRYWNGLSIGEIATRQGRQAGAVHTALSRIRKMLERCIEGALRSEGRMA
ncbi:MAG: sigma-70 family RNA polymerase sigma factor [Pirellulales bacterium]|nr:sigma-70 family RNA polymerase sigma factor [Pirellulales bacterium]